MSESTGTVNRIPREDAKKEARLAEVEKKVAPIPPKPA